MSRAAILHAVAFTSGLAVLFLNSGSRALAEEMHSQIPDEYEATGGTGLAHNNAGVAAVTGHAAVRTNPALLALGKEYSVSAGYHWPSVGREFYKAGVVDSKTAPVAAGIDYTGYMDDYTYSRDDTEASYYDSPIIRRGVIGFGHILGKVALGAGATYVEAHPLSTSEARLKGEEKVRGAGLNMGLAVALSPSVRLGAAGENLTSKKIRDYAPKIYRGGLSYLHSDAFVASLDYRQRERVTEFEGAGIDLDKGASDDAGLEKPEQMVIGSLSALFEKSFKLFASYGQAVSDDRRSLAGGVAVVSKNFSISYTAGRPYMNRSTAHQAVSLSLEMAM